MFVRGLQVRELAKKTGMDFSDQVLELEAKYEQVSWLNSSQEGEGGLGECLATT